MYKCVCGNEISFISLNFKKNQIECKYCGTVVPSDIVEKIITQSPSIILQIHLNKFGKKRLKKKILTKEIESNDAIKICKMLGMDCDVIEEFVEKDEKTSRALQKIWKSE